MEDIMSAEARRRPAPIALRQESRVITEVTPKIKILHIYAPEIIKTDVANFRELVQRLTGKPTKRTGGKRRSAVAIIADATEAKRSRHGQRVIKVGLEEEGRAGLWMEGGSTSFFMSGLEEEDGFLQQITNFPLLPVSSSSTDVIEEPHDVA